MRKKIVLLDVEMVCTIGNVIYNDMLFEALKANQITEIYLFTPYILSDKTKNNEKESAVSSPCLKLILHLEKQGFKVRGILTLLDPIYNQGPGAYYERVIKGLESRVLEGEDIAKGSYAKEYQALCIEAQMLHQQAVAKKIVGKPNLYFYFLQYLKYELFCESLAVVIVDSSQSSIEGIQKNNPKDIPFLTILAKPKMSKEAFQLVIQPFLYQTKWRDMKNRLENTRMTLEKQKVEKDKLERYQQLIKTLISLEHKGTLQVLEAFEHSIACFIADLIETSPSVQVSKLPQAVSNINDPGSQELVKSILALAEQQRLDVPQAIVQGLDVPIFLSVANASKLLSLTEQEFLSENPDDISPQRANDAGNNYVAKLGNVFFKRNKKDPGYFLYEQAVYQVSLLLGGGIVAPTRLLVVETPNKSRLIVQAGLAIGGENLEDLLCIPEIISNLEKLLEGNFRKDFAGLINESYLKDWLSKKGHNPNMSWDEQRKLFVDTLYSLSRDKRPVEFKDSASLEGIAKDLSAVLKSRPILPALALMEKYPEMIGKVDLAFLLYIPVVLKLLNRLYPKSSVEEIINEIPKLYQYFDSENISQHFLLAMLTEPTDHKGDNFKVLIEHDPKGKLSGLKIIAIDNDLAIEGSITALKLKNNNVANSTKYINLIKTIFYGSKDFAEALLAPKVAQSLLEGDPNLKVSQWISAMAEYTERCIGLLSEELNQEHNLNRHVTLAFIERFAFRLKKLQKFLQGNQKLKHEALLLEIEPVLGRYFQELRNKYTDLQGFMFALYDKQECPSLLKLLSERLTEKHSDGKTIQEHLAQVVPLEQERSSYAQALKYMVNKHQLLSFQNPTLEQILRLLMRFKGDKEWFKDQNLVMPLSLFSKLYAEQSQSFIGLMKTFRTVLFQLPNVQQALFPSNPSLLYHAMKMEMGAATVEALLAYGVSLERTALADGSTLLHFAAVYCPVAIPILAHAGIKLDAKDLSGKTALDTAIEEPNLISIKLLLLVGAGQFVSLETGLLFIQHYQRYPQLCQMLLTQNVEVSWQLGLEKISQKQKTPEGVSLEGLGGTRYLSSQIYKQIFKKGTDFSKDNAYGRHNVTAIRCEIAEGMTVGLHLKENPELPGREIMVHHLAKHLFGSITPAVALWRFSKLEGLLRKTQVAYPVLASRSIEGGNLREALDHHPDQILNLDYESVSEAIILALLTNPEDGRADNYILQPFMAKNKIQYRIISIDNDHAFVRPIATEKDGVEKEGTEGLQVKTILYCLNEMQMPLHERVRDRLLKMDPYWLLDIWLQGLESAQAQTDRLFDEKEKKKLKEAGIYLDIEFKPSIVIDIYEKLIRLQTLLRKHPESSGLMLLRHMIPNLSVRYLDVFYQYNTIDERFNALTKGCFDKQVVKGPEINVYIWPKSKVSLQKAPGILGNAIVFVKEDVDAFIALQAHFVRNGRWVTSVDKGATLKNVPVDFRTLATFPTKQNGLIDKNEKNQKELDALIQQTMTRMKFNKEHEFSKSKSVNIIQMTKDTLLKDLKIEKEQEDTPVRARKVLKEVHDQASKLKVIRDELQQGNTQSFRTLPSIDYKERIVNGTGIEFLGIDFSQMKLPDNRPDTAKQQKVLDAFSEVAFRTLRIQGCEALTDRALSNVLKSSKGLLALSLIRCSKLTVAAISMIDKCCPCLEKLELAGISVLTISGSVFNKLRVLRVNEVGQHIRIDFQAKSLERLTVNRCSLTQLRVGSSILRYLDLSGCSNLSNEVLSNIAPDFSLLEKLKLEDCHSVRHVNFYLKYPRLLSLPLYNNSSDDVLEYLMKCLEDKNITSSMLQSSVIKRIKEFFVTSVPSSLVKNNECRDISWVGYNGSNFIAEIEKMLDFIDPYLWNHPNDGNIMGIDFQIQKLLDHKVRVFYVSEVEHQRSLIIKQLSSMHLVIYPFNFCAKTKMDDFFYEHNMHIVKNYHKSLKQQGVKSEVPTLLIILADKEKDEGRTGQLLAFKKEMGIDHHILLDGCDLKYAGEQLKQYLLEMLNLTRHRYFLMDSFFSELMLTHKNQTDISVRVEKSETIKNGNCVINVVALGVCQVVLQNKDKTSNNTLKTLVSDLNPVLLRKTNLELLAWLEKETDNDKRQFVLAPVFRELAVEYIESHSDYYKESYEAGLLAAFEQYKLNQLDDTFSVHPHIRKKFEELNTSVNRQGQGPDVKEKKEGQETQALIAWWNKGVGKNPSGFQEYLSHLKLPARGAGDRERWGSEVEIGALAFRLGLTIKNVKPGIKAGQEQLLGIGYGCILGLSEPEIQHLVSLGIGSKFQSNFRIEISDPQKLAQQLQLETLTETEKAYLDKNGQETVLAFMRNSRNFPVPDIEGMKEFCDKLKRIGLFVQSQNQSLRFVNDTVLKYRLTSVPEALKKKVLAAHIQPPCFSLQHIGAHWSYVNTEGSNEENALARINSSSNPQNNSNTGLIFNKLHLHPAMDRKICDETERSDRWEWDEKDNKDRKDEKEARRSVSHSVYSTSSSSSSSSSSASVSVGIVPFVSEGAVAIENKADASAQPNKKESILGK